MPVTSNQCGRFFHLPPAPLVISKKTQGRSVRVAFFLACRIWQVRPSMANPGGDIRFTLGSQGSFQINQQPQEYYMKNETPVSASNSQPVHKIRHGAVSASIWCQETDKGQMFNVTFPDALLRLLFCHYTRLPLPFRFCQFCLMLP